MNYDDLKEEDFTTLSGLAMFLIGRIPKAGDIFSYRNLEFEIMLISPFFARCSLSSVYFIPSTPSAPLFRTTCRYVLLRLSPESICSIRLLVSMCSFLSASLDLTTLSPIGYDRCCHFCNTKHTQTYWLFAPLLRFHYKNFFTAMGSADFSQFVVTRLMRPLWDLLLKVHALSLHISATSTLLLQKW